MLFGVTAKRLLDQWTFAKKDTLKIRMSFSIFLPTFIKNEVMKYTTPLDQDVHIP